MKLQKVKFIKTEINPQTPPYIGCGEPYINKKTGQYFLAEVEYRNKKILARYQPIIFSIVDWSGNILFSHEEIMKAIFHVEILDQVLDECGHISTVYKNFAFDISSCEFMIEHNNGDCWIEENKTDKLIIHLQETGPIKKSITSYSW